MRLHHHLTLLAVLCLLLPARAEEKPDQILSALDDTIHSSVLNVATASNSPPTVTVRARNRLMFEIPLWETPGGWREPATFIFRRSGDTDESLTVYFELSGTATVDTDYMRWENLELYSPTPIMTGAVQSVVFNPGQRFRHVDLFVTRDALRENDEMIRLRVIPAPDGAILYEPGRRRCATVWISNQSPCTWTISTPGGSWACVGRRRVSLPRAFFTTEVCR